MTLASEQPADERHGDGRQSDEDAIRQQGSHISDL